MPHGAAEMKELQASLSMLDWVLGMCYFKVYQNVPPKYNEMQDNVAPEMQEGAHSRVVRNLASYSEEIGGMLRICEVKESFNQELRIQQATGVRYRERRPLEFA